MNVSRQSFTTQDAAGSATAFFRRVAATDFRRERATEWERRRLAKAGFTRPLVQNYAAWRSSLLYVAAALLLFSSIWNLATFESVGSAGTGQDAVQGDLSVVDGIGLTSEVFVLLGTLVVVGAAAAWPYLNLSRILARVGWLVMLGVPLLLALFPLASMVELRGQNPQALGLIRTFLGVLFALKVFVTIGPRVLALIPGAIRAAMALKTLLPESRGLGWLVAIFAPLWAVLLLVLLATVNQFQGSILLVLGILFLLLSTVVLVAHARGLVLPCPPQQATRRVLLPRAIAAGLTGVGAILVLCAAFDLGGADIAGDVIAFGFGVIGSVLLMTVVASDAIVPLLRLNHAMRREFAEGPLREQFEARLDGLDFRPSAAAAVEATPVETVEATCVEPVQAASARDTT
jgi:hypothetical protein